MEAHQFQGPEGDDAAGGIGEKIEAGADRAHWEMDWAGGGLPEALGIRGAFTTIYSDGKASGLAAE